MANINFSQEDILRKKESEKDPNVEIIFIKLANDFIVLENNKVFGWHDNVIYKSNFEAGLLEYELRK